MKTINYRVKDMHCVNCAMKLQALEDDLPGVHTVDASYTKQSMTITFDENILTPEEIMVSIRDLGYTPELGE